MPTLDYWERPELHRNFIDRSYLSVLLLNYIPTLLILTKLTKTNSAKGGKPNMTQQIGTAGIEPARWLFPRFFCQDRSHPGVKGYLAQKCPITHARPCGRIPNFLRSDMHHILKGAPYFRITRPLRFQISHSTGFLVTNRRRIRFTICFD